jgi:hypothetical protein
MSPWWHDFRRDVALLVLIVLAVLLAFVIAFSVKAADAQDLHLCQSRDLLLRELALSDLRKTAAGITLPGTLLELFTSADGKWAMVVTTPKQLPCIVARGWSWESYTLAEERAT